MEKEESENDGKYFPDTGLDEKEDADLKVAAEMDIHCWKEAIERFSSRHPTRKWAKDIKANGNKPTSAEDVLDAAVKATSKFERTQKSPIRRFLFHIVDQIKRHSRAIDVFSQLDPVASAIWGTVRVLLETISDKRLSVTIIVEGIDEFTIHLDRWRGIASVFSCSPRVRSDLVNLYGPLLEFIVTSTEYLEQNTIFRSAKSAYREVALDLKSKLDCVRRAARQLEDSVKHLGIKHQVVNATTLRRQNKLLLGKIEAIKEEFAAHQALLVRIATQTARFSQPPDNNQGDINAMYQPLWERSMQATSSSDEAMEWLEEGKTTVPRRLYVPIEEAGRWFLRNSRIVEWRERKVPEVLWVEGKPGSGKSVLSAILTEHLRETKQSHVISCRLHRLSDPRRSNLSALIASILFQAVQAYGSITREETIGPPLVDLMKSCNQGPHICPFSKLWPICLEALKFAARARLLFLIIDGWDECRFRDADLEPIQFLSDLQSLSRSSSIPTAIFSRPDFITLERCLGTRLRFTIDEGLNSDDIHRYALHAIPRSGIPSAYTAEIVRLIKRKASGNFLWVEAYIKYLSLPCERHVFLSRLHHSPPDFGNICDQMIQDHSTHLTWEETRLRQAFYEVICGAPEPLSLGVVGKILRLGDFDPLEVVAKIAGPLVQVRDGEVSLIHLAAKEWLIDGSRLPLSSPDGTVFVDSSRSHGRLAGECFRVLLEVQYSSRGRIGRYLHRNFARYAKINFRSDDPLPHIEPETPSYEYASKYWVYHLTHVRKPSQTLIELARDFIRGKQFAHWSEYSLDKNNNDFYVIRTGYSDIVSWIKEIPDCESILDLNDFYSFPYTRLSREYREFASEDRELRWLTNMSLARFFVDHGTALKAISVLEETVTGLTNDLGDRSPLTIKARADRAPLYFQQGTCRLREAYQDFAKLTEIQREILGLDNPELYNAILGMGGAEYFMTRYPQALASIDRAGMGLLRLCGPDSVQYMNSQVAMSYVLVTTGNLDEALPRLCKVVEKRRKIYGAGDTYAFQVQTSIGDINRKLRNQAESLANLCDSLAALRKVFLLSTIWGLDVAIAYLIALWDFGETRKAQDLLNDIDKEAGLDPDSEEHPLMYYRYCQVNHIRALFFDRSGRRNEAITLLQSILIKTDRGRYNRALMWIILDLASLLRCRDRNGDRKQAEANFDHILKVTGGAVGETVPCPLGGLSGARLCCDDDEPEPDPPRLLQLAEKALLLVRTGRFEEVDKLFEQEEVEWFCSEDLWISFGSQVADTAWMKAP